MLFENTKVFQCYKGIAHWGDRIQIVGYEVHDYVTSAMLFGSSAMHNVLANMVSQNANPANIDIWTSRMGFQFYDTFYTYFRH